MAKCELYREGPQRAQRVRLVIVVVERAVSIVFWQIGFEIIELAVEIENLAVGDGLDAVGEACVSALSPERQLATHPATVSDCKKAYQWCDSRHGARVGSQCDPQALLAPFG